jgi:F420-non-reducing hydrogenase small subunit
MSDKPKVAFYWCASCGGCEESVVDLAEDILMVTEAVDIVFWPVALDFKKSHVAEMEDASILVTLINGSIRTSEQEVMVHLLRKKSKLIVAYGSCAHMGGIPGLSNQFQRERVLQYVYEEAPTVVNDSKMRPQRKYQEDGRVTRLPEFWNVVRTLDQVIDVDYALPGCAPTPKLLKEAVLTLLSGELPPKGSVLTPDIALCDECPRKGNKPTDVVFPEFKRPHWTEIDPESCFLEQGVVCMGPATRGGCEALCVKGHMPCTGCFGPTSRMRDQGAKILSSIAAGIDAREDADIEKILAGIPDPVGTFYRYGLASSILRRKIEDPP